MQAEKMIKQYPKWKREMVMLKEELICYEGVALNDVINCMCLSRPERERVQISELPDTTAQAALTFRKRAETMSDEWYEQLLERYVFVYAEKTLFEQIIQSLSGKLPEIMYDLVIEPIPWKAIAKKHNVSLSMIGKYRKKAVKEIDEFYEMRDRHVESYILS